MLDTGYLMLDKKYNSRSLIQHPESGIQYLSEIKDKFSFFYIVDKPKNFFCGIIQINGIQE